MRRAIVDGRWVVPNARGRRRLHGALRYFGSSPAREGWFFGPAGRVSVRGAHKWLDEAERRHQYLYTLVLSPRPGLAGPERDQWERWGTEVLEELRARYGGQWLAVKHGDEQHPHLHALWATDRRLGRGDLSWLNALADRTAGRVWEREAVMERDTGLEVGYG